TMSKGKKIVVSGTVMRIEKDFSGSGNVWLRGSGLLGIHAQLSKRGTAGAASFSTGKQVELVCNGGGRLLTIATLDSCEPFNDYMKEITPSVNSRVTDFLNGRTSMRPTTAKVITLMYVAGVHLPPDSSCLAGDEDKCLTELTPLSWKQTNPPAERSRHCSPELHFSNRHSRTDESGANCDDFQVLSGNEGEVITCPIVCRP